MAPGSLLTAVVTKTVSPQTIGLDTARPGMGVFHASPTPRGASHVVGVLRPSATPDAWRPRNEGQSCASASAGSNARMTDGRTFIVRPPA